MKSAFLIVAHNKFDILKLLIKSLDYKNNDIFIHIDKKCGKIDFSEFESITKYSHVCCLRNRIAVSWGGVSQVKSTFLLLEKAISSRKDGQSYDYFHLISGVDFPLLPNEKLEDFLFQHRGKEFVGFVENSKNLEMKLGYYHLFTDSWLKCIPYFYYLNFWLLRLQKMLNIRQYTDMDYFAKGCNWWSITYQLAASLLAQKDAILAKYKYVLCSDEIFLQTFIKHNEKFLNNVFDLKDEYNGCMRLIDWNRGGPYVFQETDFEELLMSKKFFARKFGSLDTIEKFIVYRKNKIR